MSGNATFVIWFNRGGVDLFPVRSPAVPRVGEVIRAPELHDGGLVVSRVIHCYSIYRDETFGYHVRCIVEDEK